MKALYAALLCVFATGLARGADQPKIEWTTDLNKMKFPDAPVTGTVRGGPFKLDLAFHEITGSLQLLQGKEVFAEASVTIVLPVKKNAELAGTKWEVSPAGDTKGIRAVHVKRALKKKEAPQGEAYLNGYALRLEFGEEKDKKITGKIYFCGPEKDKSVIAGTFTIQVSDF